MRTLKLSVVKGPDAPITITFQGHELSIGRAKTSDLMLTDSQVSRKHAEIVREGPDFVLVDLAGANGTLVGPERRKVTRHTLIDGEVLRIGRNVVEISVANARDEESTEVRATPDPEVTATVLRPVAHPALVIQVVSGPDEGKIFTAEKNVVEIGRRPTCDVHLSDAGVSRLHATIRRDGSRYMIYDENSANGIATPGTTERLAFAELHDGMVLRLSETEIKVHVGSRNASSIAAQSSAARPR